MDVQPCLGRSRGPALTGEPRICLLSNRQPSLAAISNGQAHKTRCGAAFGLYFEVADVPSLAQIPNGLVPVTPPSP